MKKLYLAFLLLPAGVFAQAGSNPLMNGAKMMYNEVLPNIVKAAQQMPEDNYSFKPTPEVRSFGEIVAHAAAANYHFCSMVGGEKPNAPKAPKTKAEIVEAIQGAVSYCNKVMDGMTDAQATQTVNFFGHEMPKLTVLDFNTAHSDEHYGNIVTYLRLKGMVPPSSQK